MNKPKLRYNSKGESGNIFSILSKVRSELLSRRKYTEYELVRTKTLEAGTYNEALAIISEYVELIDEAEDKE